LSALGELWARLLICGRLAIGLLRACVGTRRAAIANRRKGCHLAPHRGKTQRRAVGLDLANCWRQADYQSAAGYQPAPHCFSYPLAVVQNRRGARRNKGIVVGQAFSETHPRRLTSSFIERETSATPCGARMSVFGPERRAGIGMKTRDLPQAASCVFEGASHECVRHNGGGKNEN
jgi:hypothetical protein